MLDKVVGPPRRGAAARARGRGRPESGQRAQEQEDECNGIRHGAKDSDVVEKSARVLLLHASTENFGGLGARVSLSCCQ